MSEEKLAAVPEEALLTMIKEVLPAVSEKDLSELVHFTVIPREEWKHLSLEELEEYNTNCHKQTIIISGLFEDIRRKYSITKYLTCSEEAPMEAREDYNRCLRKLRESELAPDSPERVKLEFIVEKYKEAMYFHLAHPLVFKLRIKFQEINVLLWTCGDYRMDLRKYIRNLREDPERHR